MKRWESIRGGERMEKAIVTLAPGHKIDLVEGALGPCRSAPSSQPPGAPLPHVRHLRRDTKKEPEKSLLSPKIRTNGANNMGRITLRHRLGAVTSECFATWTFRREKFGIPARVAAIEYDPNRSANLALLFYRDGEKRYIIGRTASKAGDTVMSAPGRYSSRQCAAIRKHPDGHARSTQTSSCQPGAARRCVGGAGTQVKLLAKEGDAPRSSCRPAGAAGVDQTAWTTVGQVGTSITRTSRWAKRAASDGSGFRPTVRGTVMNPVDHPWVAARARAKATIR